MHKNAFSVGAVPQIPLGEGGLQRSPDTLARIRARAYFFHITEGKEEESQLVSYGEVGARPRELVPVVKMY